MSDRIRIDVERPPRWSKQGQLLFLLSLFLYPFSVAGHVLYLVPQLLLMALAVYQLLSDVRERSYPRLKTDLLFLSLAATGTALVVELGVAEPEYMEVGKLTLNIIMVVLLLFVPGVFNFSGIARWLPRMALVFTALILIAYSRTGTTLLSLAILIGGGTSVSSSDLYALAEPLANLFLSKNIAGMYFVALYGLFMFSARTASRRIRLWEHAVFLLVILLFASRQGLLAELFMLGLARITSDVSKKRKLVEFSVATGIGVFCFLTLFNLNSPSDGAFTRLELWAFFMHHLSEFFIMGQGLHGIVDYLKPLDIGNYHMFFMNQIGAYGIFHCLAFNAFLCLLTARGRPKRFIWLLTAPYWLNVCFQTYGYEYGNLFLFAVAANTYPSTLRLRPAIVADQRRVIDADEWKVSGQRQRS